MLLSGTVTTTRPSVNFGKVLLVLQALVDRDQNIERRLREGQELAVGDASPAHFLDGLDIVHGKRFSDAWIDALV
jgi:hypothetical protein